MAASTASGEAWGDPPPRLAEWATGTVLLLDDATNDESRNRCEITVVDELDDDDELELVVDELVLAVGMEKFEARKLRNEVIVEVCVGLFAQPLSLIVTPVKLPTAMSDACPV